MFKKVILLVFYLFYANGQNYVQLNSSIYPNDNYGSQVNFGFAAHFENDTLLVGAISDLSGSGSGAVYIFSKTGSNWNQTHKLTASDGQVGDNFGWSVFRFNTTIFIGAAGVNVAAIQNTGRAYIFQYNGVNWIQSQVINNSLPLSPYGNYLGWKILEYNGYLLISVPGSANGAIMMFNYNGTSWNNYQTITSNNSNAIQFGYSFSCFNNLLIVGAPFSYGMNGSVHIFEFNGTNWVESDFIMSPQNGSQFGSSIQITNQYLFIGAQAYLNNGSFYIFKNVNNKWQQVNQFFSIGTMPAGTSFGTITVSNKLAVVGYPYDNADGTATQSGSIYLYYFNGVDWIKFENFTLTNNQASNNFGYSVCIYQNYIFVGGLGINTTGAGFIYYQTLFDNTQNFSVSNISQSHSQQIQSQNISQQNTTEAKSDVITYVIIGSVSGTVALAAVSASAFFWMC